MQKSHTISILHTGYKVIGYTFAKQSYWYKLRAGFCSNLGARGLFSSPVGFYWVHIDRLDPGHPMGAGNLTISRETETQVPAACQPQPQQPHIIKLISQLQKPTRKISDTWIIDTGKRETRYRLVKIHQTIRQPHKHIWLNARFGHTQFVLYQTFSQIHLYIHKIIKWQSFCGKNKTNSF